jgi:hypothetical protein
VGAAKDYPLQNFLRWVANKENSGDLKKFLDEDGDRSSLVKGYLKKYQEEGMEEESGKLDPSVEPLLTRGNLYAITDALLKEGNPLGPCWVLVIGPY